MSKLNPRAATADTLLASMTRLTGQGPPPVIATKRRPPAIDLASMNPGKRPPARATAATMLASMRALLALRGITPNP